MKPARPGAPTPARKAAGKPFFPARPSRADTFTESVTREMTRLSLQHNAINLAQGFPDFPCPAELKAAACDAVTDDYNQYAITWGESLVSVGALLGITSVILVLLFRQSRIFFAMSRDGLLPAAFRQVHPKFHTPVIRRGDG